MDYEAVQLLRLKNEKNAHMVYIRQKSYIKKHHFSAVCICANLTYIIKNNFMLTYLLLALLLASLYFFYRYYFKPRAEIKRYVKIFKSLGYSVYEQQFSFFGVSVGIDWDNG